MIVNKKAHQINQVSLKLCAVDCACYIKLYADLSFRNNAEGVGTFITIKNCKGCQGFIGPNPSAFLDKYLKELFANVGVGINITNTV
jgi:hypothetical protein